MAPTIPHAASFPEFLRSLAVAALARRDVVPQRDQGFDAALDFGDNREPVGGDTEGLEAARLVKVADRAVDQIAAALQGPEVGQRAVIEIDAALRLADMPMHGDGGAQARRQRLENGGTPLVQPRQPGEHGQVTVREARVGEGARSRLAEPVQPGLDRLRKGAALGRDVEAAQHGPGQVGDAAGFCSVRLIGRTLPRAPVGLVLDVAEAGVYVRFRRFPQFGAPCGVRRLLAY